MDFFGIFPIILKSKIENLESIYPKSILQIYLKNKHINQKLFGLESIKCDFIEK